LGEALASEVGRKVRPVQFAFVEVCIEVLDLGQIIVWINIWTSYGEDVVLFFRIVRQIVCAIMFVIVF
jgi:hypothetical protein